MTEDQIKHMAQRFLCWKLPEHFRPDAGIKFEPYYPYKQDGAPHEWPTGTNLFDYSQAVEMVRHMVAGLGGE